MQRHLRLRDKNNVCATWSCLPWPGDRLHTEAYRIAYRNPPLSHILWINMALLHKVGQQQIRENQ